MTTVSNYPKSSCVCYNNHEVYPNDIGIFTNMSVTNCKVPGYFDCNSSYIFNVKKTEFNDQSNLNKDKKINLNSLSMNSSVNNNNYHVIDSKKCKCSSCIMSSEGGKTYIQSDPRLYNAASGDWLQLDTTPLNSSIKLDTLKREVKIKTPEIISFHCY